MLCDAAQFADKARIVGDKVAHVAEEREKEGRGKGCGKHGGEGKEWEEAVEGAGSGGGGVRLVYTLEWVDRLEGEK